MSDNKGDPGKPSATPADTVLGHFASSWRGESGLKDTFFASVIVFAAIAIPLGFLTNYAEGAGWSSSGRLMVAVLGMIGGVLAITWFAVSVWRSARREFLSGQQFWPIVASVVVTLVVIAYAAILVGGIVDAIMRVR